MSGCSRVIHAPTPEPPADRPAEGELIPIGPDAAGNSAGADRINVVFSYSNFDTSRYLLTDDRVRRLAEDLVSSTDPSQRGIVARPPFDRHRGDFQFWFWRPEDARIVARGDSGLCSSAAEGDAIDREDGRIERALAERGMGHLIFMNLLNTDCRPQGTWVDLNEGVEIESALRDGFDRDRFEILVEQEIANRRTRFLGDGGWLERQLAGTVRWEAVAGRLFRPFRSPRTYLPINPAIARGRRGFNPEEFATNAGHEPLHAIGRLWDLYEEEDLDQGEPLARILHELNRERDLLDLLQVRRFLEFIADNLQISVEIPRVEVNLLEILLRNPAVEGIFGEPVGWPHCALSPEEGRGWARELGISNPEDLFQASGCLYFGAEPRVFYRSSDSIMYRSRDPQANPDAVELAAIERRIAEMLGRPRN